MLGLRVLARMGFAKWGTNRYNALRGSLAQLAEQGTFNPKAQGSNP